MTLLEDVIAAGFAEVDAMTDEDWYDALPPELKDELNSIAAEMVKEGVFYPERAREGAIVLIRTLAKEMR